MSAISLIEVSEAVAEAPVLAPVEVAVPVAVQAEPPARMSRVLPLVAVSLAVVASFLSVVGLVVTSRTVAGATLVVADARERQAQLAEVGELVEEVAALRVREQAALERIEQFRAAGAATPTDVNRAIDNLKHDLAKRDPEGGALALVRDGQSELADRIGQISLKLERVEQGLKARRNPPLSVHPE